MITAGRTMKALGLLSVILILTGRGVGASSAAETCSEDLARFCNGSGEVNVVLCLKQHEDDLSASCRDMLQAVQKRIDEVKRACSTDIDKLCKGIETGRGRIAECLNGHASELTPACAEQMKWVNAGLNGK